MHERGSNTENYRQELMNTINQEHVMEQDGSFQVIDDEGNEEKVQKQSKFQEFRRPLMQNVKNESPIPPKFAKFMLIRVKSAEDLFQAFKTEKWYPRPKQINIYKHVLKDVFYLASRNHISPFDIPIYLFFTVKGTGLISGLALMKSR